MKNSNEYQVAAWNFVDRFNANDKFFLMIGADHPNLQIATQPAQASPYVAPEVPSVILTAQLIQS